MLHQSTLVQVAIIRMNVTVSLYASMSQGSLHIFGVFKVHVCTFCVNLAHFGVMLIVLFLHY